ncbi:hypothetical protein ACEWY4_027390 [Coilia grayii]|uniref:SGNH hydrolase-type esterase domain-containing protein n=1 Tax=Coilia grayii TaxID=363190 RepID=A0ABD1IVC2_9TELE
MSGWCVMAAAEFLRNARPLSTSFVLTEIKSELASIEQLISVLLQKQADLGARLTCLDDPRLPSPSTLDTTLSPIPGRSTWSTVAGGRTRRSSPPVPTCQAGIASEIELQNSFAPLADLPTSPALRRSGFERLEDLGRETCPSSKPPALLPGRPAFPSPPRQHGVRKATSKRNRSPGSGGSSPVHSSDKRIRISSSPTVAASVATASLSPTGGSMSSPRDAALPLLADDVASVCSPCQSPPALSTADSVLQVDFLPADVLQLPPFTSIHFYRDVLCNPEILIVGDSIVRDLIIPSAITYCISGGRVIDISQLIPSLLDRHPSVNIVIVHVGTNDVMARSSIKLQDELETLCLTIESHGKRCIMSGPIPFNSSHSERFSRLYSLHTWLKNFCSAAGHDFIANFDIFWTNSRLYRSDGVHPNKLGLRQLTTNFIQFIAFSTL